MRQFLKQHDLIYEQPATDWVDGIPIANGAIGSMIWGDRQPLRYTLDSYEVWEQRTVWGGADPQFNYFADRYSSSPHVAVGAIG
jgi:alpha-L-fucosidase 2